ncbi:MAG: tetratricopeptide repeat protein [Ignavibacteria bacterium]|nr:tetratricopeptide repeat protein [Ignavibacteria bacterium]
MNIKFYIFFILLIPTLLAQQANLQNKFMLAQSYEQMGELERATEVYEEVYKTQPENYQFFFALNRIYIQIKEYDKSIQITEARLKSQPNDYNLVGMLGVTLYLKGEEKKTYELWDKLLEQAGGNQNVYRILSNYAIELRTFDKAIEILVKGKNASPNKTIYSYDLANLYSLRMQYAEAINEYCLLIDTDPNQIKQIEGRIYPLLARPEALPIIIETLEKKNPHINTNYAPLLINAYLENLSFEKALNLNFELDRKLNKNGTEVFSLAQRLYSLKEYSFASTAFEYLLNNYPSSAYVSQIKLGFAKTFEASLEEKIQSSLALWKPYNMPKVLLKADYEKSIDAYKEIIKSYPNSEVAVEAYYRIGVIYEKRLLQIDKAKESYNFIAQNYKMSNLYSISCEAISRIALLQNEMDIAKEYLDVILAFPRSQPVEKNLAKFRKAELLYFSGDFEESRSLVNEVVSFFKDNIANDALELSILLNTSINDSLLLTRFAVAELFIFKKKFSDAIVILEEIETNEQAIFLSNYASITKMECEIALDNFPTALKIGEKIVSKENLNLFGDKALFLSAQIYQFGIGSDKNAIELYEQLLAKYPNSLYLDKAREEINHLRKKVS